jgi:hypothetical protein
MFRVHTDRDFLFATKISLNFGITNSLVLQKGGGALKMTSPFCLNCKLKNLLSVSVTSAPRLHSLNLQFAKKKRKKIETISSQSFLNYFRLF